MKPEIIVVSEPRPLFLTFIVSSCVSCVRGGKQTHLSPPISSKIHLGRRTRSWEVWDCQLGNLTAGKGSGGGGRLMLILFVDNQPELVDLLGDVSDAPNCSDMLAAVNTEAHPSNATEVESTCSDSNVE
ncbi:hypothetical protein Tco_0803166, partial [Tanacetum coccineum]